MDWMYLRASLSRFYGFSEADYRAMNMEQFFGYLSNVKEIRRQEKGEALSHGEKVERQMSVVMKQMKKAKEKI